VIFWEGVGTGIKHPLSKLDYHMFLKKVCFLYDRVVLLPTWLGDVTTYLDKPA
jgi:hypothetical protein